MSIALHEDFSKRFLRVLVIVSSFFTISGKMQAQPVETETARAGNDTIVVSKRVKSKKHRVRIFPDASKKVLFFTASGHMGKVYQLFIFDAGGTLVKQARVRDNQTALVNKVEKGDYVFEVFSDDVRIESGDVSVR